MADSTVRDHLANERTFLAWLRTSAGVMALGVGIARFVTDDGSRYPVAAGLVLVVVGVVGLAYGTARYYRVATQIDTGEVEVADHRGPLAAAAVVLAVAILAAFILLA